MFAPQMINGRQEIIFVFFTVSKYEKRRSLKFAASHGWSIPAPWSNFEPQSTLRKICCLNVKLHHQNVKGDGAENSRHIFPNVKGTCPRQRDILTVNECKVMPPVILRSEIVNEDNFQAQFPGEPTAIRANFPFPISFTLRYIPLRSHHHRVRISQTSTKEKQRLKVM